MEDISKVQARREIGRRLNVMSSQQYFTLSMLVRRQIETFLSNQHGINSLLLYKAQVRWKEVDLSWIEKSIENIDVDYIDVHENAPFPVKTYNMIFVPLYGFSDNGYRLGHGGGWYDRFLALHPNVVKIGVGFECNRVSFRHNNQDVPMDYIITEKGVFQILL